MQLILLTFVEHSVCKFKSQNTSINHSPSTIILRDQHLIQIPKKKHNTGTTQARGNTLYAAREFIYARRSSEVWLRAEEWRTTNWPTTMHQADESNYLYRTSFTYWSKLSQEDIPQRRLWPHRRRRGARQLGIFYRRHNFMSVGRITMNRTTPMEKHHCGW